MFPRLARVCLVLGVIAFIPGIPPDLDFESFGLNAANFNENLFNDCLNDVERLFENEVLAPEHLQVQGDELYFTTLSGLIKMTENGTLTNIYRVDESCGKAICGRPLGFTFGSDGFVYLADAYNGVIRINPETGEFKTLVSTNDAVNGKTPKIPNSVVVSKETGKIYWTDSSSELQLHQLLFLFLGNGRGRLIEYDPSTKLNKVLIDNLHFANGVMLAEDESFVMVAETFKSRILRHYLKGEKAGQTDIFIDNLPGMVDNINRLDENAYVVAIVNSAHPLTKFAASSGLLRKLGVRLLSLSQLIIRQLSHWVSPLETVDYFLSSPELSLMILPSDPSITSVIFNDAGQITEILRGTDGTSHYITSATKFKGFYYLGSFVNPYLGRVKIPNGEPPTTMDAS